MNAKSFFLFSLSITLLCACGFGGYYLWEHKQEKLKQEQERLLLEKSNKEKRDRLDEFYLNELEMFKVEYLRARDCANQADKFTWLEDCEREIQKTKDHMFHDGYDGAMIDKIETEALKKARKYYNDFIKK